MQNVTRYMAGETSMQSFNINRGLRVVLPVSLLLGACVSTQVMPVAPNAVQINTQAKGLLFRGRAVPETMITAAKETLVRGYTHFKFANVNSGQGSEIVGANTWGNGNVVGDGNTSNINAYSNSSVMRAPTEASGATVLMFHANEAGAKGGFEARQVLAQYQLR